MPASSNVVEFTITFGSMESGSCGKTCRRACWLNLEAHPAQDESEVSLRICSRDMGSHPLSEISIFESRFSIGIIPGVHGGIENRKWNGGEDRNRTYLGPGYAEPTTVLKTARTTRHPSLSGLLTVDCGLRIEFFARSACFGVRRLDAAFEVSTRSGQLSKDRSALTYFAFLIAVTMASKS